MLLFGSIYNIWSQTKLKVLIITLYRRVKGNIVLHIRSKVRTICKEYREFYCKDCSDSHALLKITRDHVLIDLTSSHCDICQMKGIKSTVRTICKECREFYCQDCSHTHSIMKLTRDHPLIDLDPHDCQDSPQRQDTPLMTSESRRHGRC